MNRITIVLFGPYGSGKGTQARLLTGKYSMYSFDTGGVLRENVKKKTPLGLKAKEVMDRGDLVSNDLIMEITSDWIDKIPTDANILFDGIPRYMEQALSFDELLEEKSITPIRFYINIPEEESIKRQIGRRICNKCGEIYPFDFKDDNCIKCADGILETRKENDPAIAEKRASVFKEETTPVINYYKNKGSLIEIDGLKKVEEIQRELINYIEKINEN